ncbi:MAG: hypothetical protein QGH94_03565 [Phycisphaerae bacterium]|nr:hypothetical protein [Phycisphaerae bacterium]
MIREWLERARRNADRSEGGRTRTSSPKRTANRAPRNYYIDSVRGSDRNSGRSTSSAWKSHTKAESELLAAGDVIHFKRGSAFSGNIEISESGTAARPIRLTSYGTGELPKFTNPTTSDASGNAIILRGDYIIVESLHFHDTPGEHVSGMIIMTQLAALRIDRGADHCIIRNCEFIKTGQGIMSAGEHTLITKNYLDGPSYALWRTSKSSWGPMGIHLNIGNQEVSYNTIKNFGTKDSPWGSDGGAIEIDCGRYHKKNIYIHHNYSEGNAGFLESSWDYDWPRYSQEIHNWRVSFNVCYDGQSWLFMLAPGAGIYFDNNTIARYNGFGRAQNSGARLDVRGGSPVGVASGLHFRNNLFIYSSSPYTGNRSGGALKTANWYSKHKSPGAKYGGDKGQVGSGDPLLVDPQKGDYHLKADSPLRGKGINLSKLYKTDFDGRPLPKTGKWDIGAIQYSVTKPTYPLASHVNSRKGSGAQPTDSAKDDLSVQIQSDDFKVIHNTAQLKALQAKRPYAGILIVLDRAAKTDNAKGKEAKIFAERLRALIAGENKTLLEQSKTEPAKSLIAIKGHLRYLVGLPEGKAMTARYKELRGIRYINTLVAYYQSHNMIERVTDPRRKKASLQGLSARVKKFVAKDNLDDALLNEAKALLSKISEQED